MRYQLTNAHVTGFSTHGNAVQKDLHKLKQNLTKSGLSPMGAQQALTGQAITSPADRTALANLLAQLGSGPKGPGAINSLHPESQPSGI